MKLQKFFFLTFTLTCGNISNLLAKPITIEIQFSQATQQNLNYIGSKHLQTDDGKTLQELIQDVKYATGNAYPRNSIGSIRGLGPKSNAIDLLRPKLQTRTIQSLPLKTISTIPLPTYKVWVEIY